MSAEINFKLRPHDRGKLLKIVNKGTERARAINRCRILLLAGKKESPGTIVDVMGCTYKTIQNIKGRYMSAGLNAAIYDAPRSGAPTKFDGKDRAKLTALACSSAPDGRAKWSLVLLADKAVELGIVEEISPAHVGRILKKTK